MRLDNRSNGNVTILDVARAAGVAPSTVSYVLSGRRSISAQTRRQVEEVVRELGYQPRAVARESSRANVLALLVPSRIDIDLAVVMPFMSSVAAAARAHDHDLLLLTKNEGPEGLGRVTSLAIADAFIVMDVEPADPRIPVLRSLNRPVVLIGAPDRTTGPTGLACVDLDITAAAASSVTHLAELGHRAVALIGQSPAFYHGGTSVAARFMRGFNDTARTRRLRASARACAPSYEALRTCLDELFAANPTITGLVVQSEAVLPYVLADLRQRGKRVPEDISVVAICPESTAENQAVALTTVAIPVTELGEIAVEMTIRQLERLNQKKPPLVPETRLLSPRLTQRDSTASPLYPPSSSPSPSP